ncbi:hypothetical protein CEP54_016139 [Fusarium duplospermum]|uniref:beta-glucosidase n=1 Tax=Fusarium duplospermum TaxID=1325734 RepID=A0A428NHU7_9HYPO|nr:hypothetical protein CEP54_016139 [Fusarium duplospermum]
MRSITQFALAASSLYGITQGLENITDDTYFYGLSQPVYPAPNGTGSGDWAESYAKARAMVARMTLEEKANFTISIPLGEDKLTSCQGRIAPIERLGFPGMCLADAGNGLRWGELTSMWPSGISVAASWNKDLALQRAIGMGSEFAKKSLNVIFGPVVGPLGRVATGGRNWEGLGYDPWLSGALVRQTVKGIQGAGVIASLKHFVGNEQETRRSTNTGIDQTVFAEDILQAVSVNVDDKTLHELYLWPFVDALEGGVANIMCSYNRLNNSYACQNSHLLNGILKTELGFQGFVLTDWGAQHAGVANAEAGMDSAALPEGGNYETSLWGKNLTLAVQNGTLPEHRLDDMVTRVLAPYYKLGQDQRIKQPGLGFPADHTLPHAAVDAVDPAMDSVRLQGAIEAHVLVKNSNQSLPLKKPQMLSIYGYSAKIQDFYHPNDNLAADVPWNVVPKNDIWTKGTLFIGGGSGATGARRAISPMDAIRQRAWQDRTQLFWDFDSAQPGSEGINANTDACLVFGNAYASEGVDKEGLRDDYTDGLILSFFDHPNITAIIMAHLPGEESGNALVQILYGEANPSGKLPYTVAKNESDYGPLLLPDQAVTPYGVFPQSNFTEGNFIDYRHFDREGIEPRYAFGFGLSYTTFALDNLAVAVPSNGTLSRFPRGPILQGGAVGLWDVVGRVTARVTNTGDVAGAEVAQLYLGIPDDEENTVPARQLRGFVKPFLQPGEAADVTFDLTRRDLSVWDVTAQQWSLGKGEYKVYVGTSSRDLPLQTTFSI